MKPPLRRSAATSAQANGQGPHLDAIVAADLGHLVGVLVGADAAHVDGGARDLEHPLSDADAVLGGAARDELDVGASCELLQGNVRREVQARRPLWSLVVRKDLMGTSWEHEGGRVGRVGCSRMALTPKRPACLSSARIWLSSLSCRGAIQWQRELSQLRVSTYE